MMYRFVFCVCLFACLVSGSKITNLPGLTFTPSFDQYSGYITLTNTSKNMFYWFVESQNDPASDPLVIWLQGGPGCSGLIGFFQEHGPYLINTSGNLIPNYYSWNREANMLYIESPVGVGFSYSDNPNDYNTNDNQTASDNYQFLLQFLDTFPQYKQNEFWILGESYAGVYGPMLANLIVEGSDTQLISNFQGFALGNPVTSCPALKDRDLDIQINTFYWNGLIGLRSLNKWKDSGCDESQFYGGCGELYEEIISSIGPIEGDDLYYNYCTGNGTLNAFEQTPGCVTLGDLLEEYLNRADVQQAIFAEPIIWTECGNPKLNYHLQGQNMMKYYESFFVNAPQLKIMIYSGDVDISTVPHAKTQICLQGLDRNLVQSWTRWTVEGPPLYEGTGGIKQNITAGYVEVYDTYTFATIKGAGHEAPQYQPAFSYNLFQRFVLEKSANLNAIQGQ